uniref:Inter-alpha-trypsin inhibitor heavy chain C-terminal domain-containing protein n=1 Tax=Ciona savignyi TaxID=51511 RepID=H2ZPD1_CIOSA
MRRPELALDFAPPARVSSESKGGFSGDPHFIVPLTPKINLCFNWDGEDGEVYNLLYDPTQNLTVNGDIVAVAAPPGSMKPNRTYISNLYIHIPQQKFKIIVRPYNVTFIPVGAQPFTVPVTTPIRFNGKGIRFQVHGITHTRARIDVIIDGLNFQVVLHRNNRHLYSTDHLDFSVRSSGSKLGRGVDGVIGQFLNSHVIVLNGDAEEKEAFILIDEQLGQVTRTKKKLPTDRGMIECWFARNNARELTRHAHERYLVDKLTAEPFYSVE